MDTNKMDTDYIYELVKEPPNDSLLGEKIRQYVWKLEKAG